MQKKYSKYGMEIKTRQEGIYFSKLIAQIYLFCNWTIKNDEISACANSENYDQPSHPYSFIRTFAHLWVASKEASVILIWQQ